MRILVAEDDRVSALVLVRALERLGHEPALEPTGADAWARFQRERFPMLISDWMMPRLDGLALCERVRSASTESYTYFALLTARTQRDDRLRALDAGVDDFLTKPLDMQDLAARVRVAERILAWHEQLERQARELDRMRREAEYLASHDVLTGVLSRRAWFDQAAEQGPLALAVFDVDHFKQVNDRYGHPAGDTALREVAQRVAAEAGEGGVVGRIGGEEFAVAFSVPLNEAEATCRRIVESVSSVPVRIRSDLEVTVSVSAGLAPCPPQVVGKGDGPLLRAYDLADRALYDAKAAGRRRLVTYAQAA